METTVAVASSRAAEDLRQLQAWLLQEPELRGRVRLAERPPEPGHLGGAPELVSVLLGPGAATSALASALITWLRHRTSDVDCTITKSDGSTFHLSAKRVQESGMDAHHELIRDAAARLAKDGAAASGEDAPPTESPQPEK